MRPAISDAPSIGSVPSGTIVVQLLDDGFETGAATILRFGAFLSTCK